MDSITDTLFKDLRIIFRAAMNGDLKTCSNVMRFREKWDPILRTLEGDAWKYIDLNDEDWEDYVKELLGVE